MKVNILVRSILILVAVFSAGQSYSQAKKQPVKKTVVADKTKSTAKANAPVAKSIPVKNKTTTTAKKVTPPPVKTINKTAVTSIPNKQVNNSEITNVTLTSREQEMINEINSLRLNPAKYCTYVENYLQKNDLDENVKVAAKELVTILKKMKPLNPLTINPSMYIDAKQYGLLMAKRNVFEHSTLPYYENLSLGYRDIRDAIVDLLIDDGIPDRGHRKNLLNDNIKQVAVFELPGKVQDIGYCYVQEFK